MRTKHKNDGNHGKGGMVSGNARYNRAKTKRNPDYVARENRTMRMRTSK